MKRRGGFTAAELMVAMAMIGFATAILTVAFHGAKDRARTCSCTSNVRQLGLSSRMYMQDNDGRMPPPPPTPQSGPGMFDLYALPAPGEPPMRLGMDEELPMSDGSQIGGLGICGALHAYTKNQQMFTCPMAPRREKPPEWEAETEWADTGGWFQVDYIFNISARTDDPPTTILVSDDVPDRHPGRTWNGVRVDGAAVRMRADRWDDFWVSGPCGDW